MLMRIFNFFKMIHQTFHIHIHLILQFAKKNKHVYILRLSVRLCPISVKTAEQIGPKLFVGPHVTPGKVYG